MSDATEPTTSPGETLESRIAPSFRLRSILIMLMCLVLGLWGVYDYVWAIPTQAEHALRRDVSQDVLELLETAASADYNTEARDRVVTRLTSWLQGLDATTTIDPAGIDDVEPASNEAWMISMAIYIQGLESKPTRGGEPSDAMRMAGVVANRSMNLYGDAQAPSAYDRPVQWLFILSLLFVPFYGWNLLKYGPGVYQLDPDGTLHLPEGTWSRDEIADIDMSRWMAKSTAVVEHVDGTRIKLDAYIYKNLHLIIGAIAHRFHPDQWEEDGRKVKPVAEGQTKEEVSRTVEEHAEGNVTLRRTTIDEIEIHPDDNGRDD